jgi:hypothetical protein
VPKEVSGFKLEADELIASKSRQASPDSFTNSGGKGPDSGAGQELVGKTFTNPTYNLAVKITKVERLTEIKSGSKTLKPRGNGVYLVVVYQATNNGDKELNSTAFKLKDNLGRIFVGGGYEASIAMSDKYPSISSLGPGKTGNDFRVFEVVRDAKGFEPTDTDF